MGTRLLAVVCGVLLASCGGTGSGDPPSTTEPSVTITRASNQQTVTAHVGDHVQVALGEDINWQLEPPDGTVLAVEANRSYMLVRGTQAIWLARSVGRSTIRASGGANCPSGAACPLYLAVFTATVDVVP